MLIPAHEMSLRDIQKHPLADVIYNGFDSGLTFEVDDARRALGRNDTLIYDFERAMQGPALEMMCRGFRVDMNERENAIIAVGNKLTTVQEFLSHLIVAIQGNFNEKLPNSPTQLQALFYDTMKIKPIEKTLAGETKRPMDRETLEKLANRDRYAETLINGILLYRDLTKALQVLETEVDTDWRWRCAYNIGGTKTGRWSSSKSPFLVFNEESQAWKSVGNNFQNVTEELRRVFIPDLGFKLYGIDKAQSEARDFGWLCGLIFNDWSYLSACESGDLHTNVTRLLYPEWNWTSDPKRNRQIAERRFYRLFTYRDASKRLGHATNYYGKPREISRQTRIPLDLVEEFQRRYFAAFPCIPKMHQWVAQQLQTKRYLVNSFGRRRDFFDNPNAEDTLKSAIAYLFQSATGDCLNLGLYRLWKRMGTRIQILSQLHDAVYFQAPIPANDSEEQVMLREALSCIEVQQTDPKSGRSMVIPGEIVGGFNWAHRFRIGEDGIREEWNPKGLDGIHLATAA